MSTPSCHVCGRWDGSHSGGCPNAGVVYRPVVAVTPPPAAWPAPQDPPVLGEVDDLVTTLHAICEETRWGGEYLDPHALAIIAAVKAVLALSDEVRS